MCSNVLLELRRVVLELLAQSDRCRLELLPPTAFEYDANVRGLRPKPPLAMIPSFASIEERLPLNRLGVVSQRPIDGGLNKNGDACATS